MKTITLLRALARRFPKRLKESFDHVGLMTGKLKPETRKILLCLDFDDVVMERVPGIMPDLILSHHPFIFGTKYRVFKDDPIKKDLADRIDALDIPVYSMHTNFDAGRGGMNDALAEALGLKGVKPLETAPMARGGTLPTPMEIHAFAHYVNERLGLKYSHLVHAGKDVVRNMAIIGGGGSREYVNAMDEGYDVFVSGDVPHHTRRDVIARHYNFLDVTHEIERIFMPTMKKLLLEIDPTLEITIVDHEEPPELIREP